MSGTITEVPGIRVGHAVDPSGCSGCTVVLGPFRGAVEVSGFATGSRELGVLSPYHMVPRIDAVLLTGGSALGLDAAQGVVDWLAERREGFQVRGEVVPIVPAAVIYDLATGVPRPNAALGRAACEVAGAGPLAQGRVGVGAGATVGKVAGPELAMNGGLGSSCLSLGPYRVGALTVVNAFGDVLDAWGGILAGARDADGVFLNTSRVLREQGGQGAFSEGVAQNTTLSVVATDAPLSRVDLGRMARIAISALPRRISPVNTPFDGDITFVLSTTPKPEAVSVGQVLALGTAARDALELAIEASVTTE